MPETPSLDPRRTGDPGSTVERLLAAANRAGGDGIPAAGSNPAARYLLGEELARGGMGVIHRATDTVLGREVAVKVLQERFAPESGVARRFADEARIAAQLQHPDIPPVHDLGTLPDGRPFLAMKLIKGRTLETLLKQRPDPSADRGRLLAIFDAVCQAVGYAHAHRVIHRDLKPANVMVGSFGEVQVMDWGLAKVLATQPADADPAETAAGTEVRSLREYDELFTQAGSVLGTPAFMPPEQAVGAVGKVDQRSDVFGLGAILAVILTGQPPFTANSAETTRLKAAQGDVADCFTRLATCGAEPELVALCRRCLSPRPADRPADAGEVAQAVAGLRTAADERARRAELDKARVEAEKAAAEARALERRRRRRLGLGAAAALVLATLGGLGAVLLVQHRANADLEAKNQELARQQVEVEARFELARRAIATFHTGVSEDFLLGNDQFQELRARLLKEAAGFYADLEKLLEGRTDPRSRGLLAAGYAELGELTEKIGDQREALAVQEKALALRRELASAPGADVETRLDVARSLHAVGRLLNATGDTAGALRAWEEQRDLAAALAAESPTDPVRAVLGQAHYHVGTVLRKQGRTAEALSAYEKARHIREELAEANPAGPQYQRDLADTYDSIGSALFWAGRGAEALKAKERARDMRRALAEVALADIQSQRDLAAGHHGVAWVLSWMGKPAEALGEYEKAAAIHRKLTAAHPADTRFQNELALAQLGTGGALWQMGEPDKALAAKEEARDIYQKLAGANFAVTWFRYELAHCHDSIGEVLLATGRPADALKAHESARGLWQGLADEDKAVPDYQCYLAQNQQFLGAVLWRTGRAAEARAALDRALAIQQSVVDTNPADILYQGELARILHDLSMILSEMGQPGAALAACERARDVRLKLVDANPDVVDFRSDLALSHQGLGLLLSRAGKSGEALREYEAARDLFRKLADDSPAMPWYQVALARSYGDVGWAQARKDHFPEAFTALDAAVTLGKRAADARPSIIGYATDLGYSYAYRGWAHVRAGHPANAAADLRRAIELWAKDTAPNVETRFERSRALALLAALGSDANSGVAAAEGATFADQAVAALQDAVRAGWAHGDELKEPDFDVLRRRDDFQGIAKEVSVKSAVGDQSNPE